MFNVSAKEGSLYNVRLQTSVLHKLNSPNYLSPTWGLKLSGTWLYLPSKGTAGGLAEANEARNHLAICAIVCKLILVAGLAS